MAKDAIIRISEAEAAAVETEKAARRRAAELIENAGTEADSIRINAEQNAESIMNGRRVEAHKAAAVIAEDIRSRAKAMAAGLAKKAESKRNEAVSRVKEVLIS